MNHIAKYMAALLLAAGLTAGLGGCKAPDPAASSQGQTSSSGAQNPAQSIPQIQDQIASQSQEPGEGIEAMQWQDYAMEISGTVITLPCTMADIRSAGLELQERLEPKVLQPGEVSAYPLEVNNANFRSEQVMLTFYNFEEMPQAEDACTVVAITIDLVNADPETLLNYRLPGGLRVDYDLSPEQVVEVYGPPAYELLMDSVTAYSWYPFAEVSDLREGGPSQDVSISFRALEQSIHLELHNWIQPQG